MHKIYNKITNFITSNNYHIILPIIVLSAFLLRIWGIWNIENQDEYNEVFEALRVSSGQLNFERWVKRFYLYILSFAYGVYYLIGWAFQIFQSPIDFATKIVRDMEPLFLIGRSISALFGTASVFMTYLIGKSLFKPSIGLIASLFFSLNVINIQSSHYATVDATLCLTVLISFYFIAQLIMKNRNYTVYYLLAGLFSGIAFQTKAPAIILLIPFLLSHIYRSAGKKAFQYIYSKDLCYYAFSFLLGMTIGNPAILFAPQKYLKSLIGLSKVFTTAINVMPSEHIGFIAYPSYFLKGLGLLFVLLVLYALFKAFLSRKPEELLLLSFIIPFFVLIGASKFMVFPRYMVPIMPLLYILCARYLTQVLKSLPIKPHLSNALLIGCCFVVLIHPFRNVVKYEMSVSGKDTKILAKVWIEKNIPFESKILMDSGKSINTIGPKIAENREAIHRILASRREAIENYNTEQTRNLVTRDALIYYELLLKTVPDRSYDVTYTKFGLEVKSLDYYISNQYQYLIIAKSMKDRAKSKFFTARFPGGSQFYKSLDTDKRVQLIKTIRRTRINRGHTYYIYKLRVSS